LKSAAFPFVILCVFCVSGCGLAPVPYATDLSGPVRGISVMDYGTGADIPDALVSVQHGMGMVNWEGSGPPQLLILHPESTESRIILAQKALDRREDKTFKVPRQIQIGLIAAGYMKKNPPTAMVSVSAPDYPLAVLQYCIGRAPETGWSDKRVLAGNYYNPADTSIPEAGVNTNVELVRCEFQQDGILRFYLRHLTPEIREAISSPGQSVASPEEPAVVSQREPGYYGM
jgi:hypothetical protein